MFKRTIRGFVVIGGLLLVAGCGGPVQVGTPAGGGDEGGESTPTPTPSGSGSFSISVAEPSVDMWIGGFGQVDVTISPVDGYTGTVSLVDKSARSDLAVTYKRPDGTEIASGEVTLDGTNAVDVVAEFASLLEENGEDVTVPAPFEGAYELEFSDDAQSEVVEIDAKVGPIWAYTLHEVNTAIGEANQDPFFPHEGTMTVPTGVVPVFVHDGSEPHCIHVNGDASNWSHMDIATGESDFANGLAWNPVQEQFVDLSDPAQVADIEANGVIADGSAGANPSFYCHSNGGELHGNIDSGNPVQVQIVAP